MAVFSTAPNAAGKLANPPVLCCRYRGLNRPNYLISLAVLAVNADTDDEGKVIRLQFRGNKYNELIVAELAKLKNVSVIGIRNTAISIQGAA